MARYPEGYKRCDNRNCRDGWVQEYVPGPVGLEPGKRHKCPVCRGAGQIVNPKYIKRLRDEANELERKANKLIGKGQPEKVQRYLNAVFIKRQKADHLERNQ